MEAEIKMNLPIKLASLRKQNGLTQLELAEKLNVSRQAISRWEVGTAVPSTDNLRVLSNLYGVSVDYLLNDNADDSYKNSENLEQEPEEQEWTQRRIIRYVLAYAVALIMVIVIIICVTMIHGQKEEQEQVTPIGEMDSIVEDRYPAVTFSID